LERNVQGIIGLNDGSNEKPLTLADIRTVIRTRSLQSISYEHRVLSMVVTNLLYHSVVSIVGYWLCAYCKVRSHSSLHFQTFFHSIRHVPFIQRNEIIFTLYSTTAFNHNIFTLMANKQLVETLR